ncbi:hypothetical protein [Anoxybacteroides amylolyticum]|uniref:hypothetical protein n=1 Tax=Anoxybacteroides amylolyticum TaxID=294699 RepID=UPI0011DF7466|nr:hypothetical protein [Anoxybacillus amylolyticus]
MKQSNNVSFVELELFAEELPEQHNFMASCCWGSIACFTSASTFGSCAATASCSSTASCGC